jgi:hypothetical protein
MTEITVPEKIRHHPVWYRLNDQLDWYDRKSTHNQNRYKQIKPVQLVIPWTRWVTAILEGVQQLGQYQALWVN